MRVDPAADDGSVWSESCGREMSDSSKDPAIKLFGRTIAFPDGQTGGEASEDSDLAPTNDSGEVDKDASGEVRKMEIKDQEPENINNQDCNESDMSSVSKYCQNMENQPCSMDDKVATASKSQLSEQEHSQANASGQEKVLKKPDKILPCPRCNSMDTKFCYYNNYNVNQPRHFCKNCQRYWTAGGTMRNVPVGAGRRKTKHSSSHYRHLVVSSDGMPSPQVVDDPVAVHGHLIPSKHSAPSSSFTGNRTVLKFGQEVSLSESIINTLNDDDQKRRVEVNATIHGENMKEQSGVSSVTASNCMENENSHQSITPGPCNGLTSVNALQCYPGSPWAYLWGPGWNNIAAIAAGQCNSNAVYSKENGGPNLIPWSAPPIMPAPAFVAPPVPFPLMPASYWGCMPTWPGGTWNAPWPGANGNLSQSSLSNSEFSGNNSAILGKHSRDAASQATQKTEKSLWIPKTLRIDDPDEAAKSSIWATLGIKPDRDEPFVKSGMFKSFESRADVRESKRDATHVLHANPAALSRSNTFQETT